MKRLLFLAGSADSSFVRNEIRILKEFFDDICILSYPVSEKCFQNMVKENGIRGHIIPKLDLSLITIRDYFKWFSLKHVQNEIKNHTNFSVKGVKRFFYICHYGLYAVNSYRILKKEIDNKGDDCEIYLYAFWLSRPSYTAGILKWMYEDKIIKTVARAHRHDLYEERNSTEYLPFREFITAHVDEIHFISDNGKSYFYDKIREKYHIVKMPILALNYLGTYNEQGLKKTIRDKTKVVIASCALVSPVKRLDLIVEFLSEMKEMTVRWIHIGDGKVLGDIKRLTKDKIPNMDVQFYGNVENEKILPIYVKEDVDFLINMSDSEGLPVSIMEAMSVGIPVIARNVGGISEIVNNENGCLLDGTGIKEKETVRQFVMMRTKNVYRYREFSENALRTWKENYNAEVNYRKFCKELIDGQCNVDY